MRFQNKKPQIPPFFSHRIHFQPTLPLKTPARLSIHRSAHALSHFNSMNALTRCLETYWSSSIGKKLVVALTGIVLVSFLVGHLIGNLVVFLGPEPFNEYAYFLHHMLHGAGIWVFRVTMLAMLVVPTVATQAIGR